MKVNNCFLISIYFGGFIGWHNCFWLLEGMLRCILKYFYDVLICQKKCSKFSSEPRRMSIPKNCADRSVLLLFLYKKKITTRVFYCSRSLKMRRGFQSSCSLSEKSLARLSTVDHVTRRQRRSRERRREKEINSTKYANGQYDERRWSSARIRRWRANSTPKLDHRNHNGQRLSGRSLHPTASFERRRSFEMSCRWCG